MRKLLGLGVASWVCCAVPAMAAPITVTDVEITGKGVSISSPGYTGGVTAGLFSLSYTSSFGPGTFLAFCVDLYHFITTGAPQALSYTVGALTTSNPPNGPSLTSDQLTKISQLAAYGTSLYKSNPANAAGLATTQVAIWSVEYGSAFNYTPTADVTATSVSDAETAAFKLAATSDFALLSTNGTQNFVVSGSTNLATVPEPAAVAMVAAGLVMLAGMRRRV